MSQPIPPVTPGSVSSAYLLQLLGTNAPVILEIGANDGSHTLSFLRLFPNAKIYAFEPDPRALAKFKSNISDPRVRLFEMAIGAMDGETKFYSSSGLPPDINPADAARYPKGWDQSGSLRAPKTHKTVWPWCKFESTVTIKVRRLDTWARENGISAVDFIWADMQGAEGDLISGGQTTLSHTRFLYTEYSDEEWYEGQPNLQQILEMLPNFTVLKLYPEDVLLKNNSN
jgi:2-O-methyltransferase